MIRGSSGGPRRSPGPQRSGVSRGSDGLSGQGLFGHRGPQETHELARDSDDRDSGAFAVVGQMSVAAVQPNLGFPGARVGLGSAVGSAGLVSVRPRGLDQQPAGVLVAGLGDVPAMALGAGGVFAGHDPQPRAQLTGMAKASEVADLGDEPERRAGRDPA